MTRLSSQSSDVLPVMHLAASVGADCLVSGGNVRREMNYFHFMMLLSIFGLAIYLISEGFGHNLTLPFIQSVWEHGLRRSCATASHNQGHEANMRRFLETVCVQPKSSLRQNDLKFPKLKKPKPRNRSNENPSHPTIPSIPILTPSHRKLYTAKQAVVFPKPPGSSMQHPQQKQKKKTQETTYRQLTQNPYSTHMLYPPCHSITHVIDWPGCTRHACVLPGPCVKSDMS
jgi:hypothetical protein